MLLGLEFAPSCSESVLWVYGHYFEERGETVVVETFDIVRAEPSLKVSEVLYPSNYLR